MEDLKNTIGWGAGLLITTAVASKAIKMIPKPKKTRIYRRKKKY